MKTNAIFGSLFSIHKNKLSKRLWTKVANKNKGGEGEVFEQLRCIKGK